MQPTVIALSGSARPQSRSSHLLRTFVESLGDQCAVTELSVVELNLPMYAPGGDFGQHPGLARFAEAIGSADALVVVSPVYQESISGLLKNAFDHVHDMRHQPVGLVGRLAAVLAVAEGGQYGKTLAHLRTVLMAMGATVLPGAVGASAVSFDDDRLYDPIVRTRIAALAQDLVEALARRAAEQLKGEGG